MTLSEIKKPKTLVDVIARNLINHIAEKGLEAGDQLPSERSLVEMTGASRLPMREALCMLKALGIVEAHHGKGLFVRQIDLRNVFEMLGPLLKLQRDIQLTDIMTVRYYLEGSIAEVAAVKRKEKDLRRLRQHVEGMEQAVGDIKEFVQHDMGFHNDLARSTGNVIFDLFMSVLGDLVSQVQFSYPDGVSFREDSIAHHREILEAIEAGDAAKAGNAMRTHSKSVEAAICQS